MKSYKNFKVSNKRCLRNMYEINNYFTSLHNNFDINNLLAIDFLNSVSFYLNKL